MFASNADYRGYVLLPVASVALAPFAGMQWSGIVRTLAAKAYEQVFDWLCSNFPDAMVGENDTKSQAVAEITLEFLAAMFEPDQVKQAFEENADLRCAHDQQFAFGAAQ